MEFHDSNNDRFARPGRCRNCQGNPQPMPYEDWQGMPWRDQQYMQEPRRPMGMQPRHMEMTPWQMGMPPGNMGMQPGNMRMPSDQMGMPPYQPMPGIRNAAPYYMSYPYPLFMQGEDDDERDMERLMSMFPESAQMIQPIVEEECDRMEYDGSLMFDEYPDKVMMEKLIESIYQRIQNAQTEESMEGQEADTVYATQCRNCKGNRFGDGLQDLISVMLFEEMHRRRCRHRRCKRWW